LPPDRYSNCSPVSDALASPFETKRLPDRKLQEIIIC